MHVQQLSLTVADFLAGLARGDIVVNREYQRSARVWPVPAQAFLIETILLGYPMPKLGMYQITDVRTKRTIKEIVDGQQRSYAIKRFCEGKYRLSKKSELEYAGQGFDELDDEGKHKILSYGLPIDLYIGATPADIREVFRRQNSYQMPLTPEEQRHAEFQGKFKWWVYRVTKDLDQALRAMGLFTEAQLVRMQDTKLISEIAHALLHGITTTNKNHLRRLYADNDTDFPAERELDKRVRDAFSRLLELRAIHRSALMKPYHAYSLLLAITHVKAPVETLAGAWTIDEPAPPLDVEATETNLSGLVAALEEEDEHHEFRRASEKRTNVKDQRTTRFRWFCRALTKAAP